MARRGLTPLEEAEARLVFGDGVVYHRVSILEDAGWTNALARAHGWLSGRRLPPADSAIALGHNAYFPRCLRATPAALAEQHLGDFAWLIHELTHVWQAERIGLRYLFQALCLQLRAGRDPYSYGGEAAIQAAVDTGRNLDAFTVEQQAEIARDYYVRRRMGADVQAWEPLMMGFRVPRAAPRG